MKHKKGHSKQGQQQWRTLEMTGLDDKVDQNAQKMEQKDKEAESGRRKSEGQSPYPASKWWIFMRQRRRWRKSSLNTHTHTHTHTHTQHSKTDGHDSPVWNDPWRRQWRPTPVLLPGKSHGRRSLVGCSPWGHEESDTTERLHFHLNLHYSRQKYTHTQEFHYENLQH